MLRKKLFSQLMVFCLIIALVFSFASCKTETSGGDATPKPTGSTATEDPGTATPEPTDDTPKSILETLDTSVSGEVTILCWGGDDVYYADIGHQDWAPEDITSGAVAFQYPTAKLFNQKFPNVKINVMGVSAEPDTGDKSWAQVREDIKNEYGRYPDLFATHNLINDILVGAAADLSRYENDPTYSLFNPTLMKMMNYYGFQAGIPYWVAPWVIPINKEVAENNNIDIPSPNWTIDEYTEFISQADMETFYGDIDIETVFILSAAKSIAQQANENRGSLDKDYVNLNADDVKTMIDYAAKWASYGIYPQWYTKKISDAVMDENWWWDIKFFYDDKLLCDQWASWYLGGLADQSEANEYRMEAGTWDVYPFPSTADTPNSIGLVLDPMVIHNYSMDDGNPAWSEEENTKLDISYAYLAFMLTDLDAYKAVTEQMYLSGGTTLRAALSDSFPTTTGELLEKQMELWFNVPSHEIFKDKEVMPGFHEVLRIYDSGFSVIDGRTFPQYCDENGTKVGALDEFNGLFYMAGDAFASDPNWADLAKAALPEINQRANERFRKAEQQLRDALKQYYGFTDDDFN